jgi:hypothetical protein
MEFIKIIENKETLEGSVGALYSVALDTFLKDDQPLNENKCVAHFLRIWDESHPQSLESCDLRRAISSENIRVSDDAVRIIRYGEGKLSGTKLSIVSLKKYLKAMKKTLLEGIYILGKTDFFPMYYGIRMIEDKLEEYISEKEMDLRMEGIQRDIRRPANNLNRKLLTYCEDKYLKIIGEAAEQIKIERKAAVINGTWQNEY